MPEWAAHLITALLSGGFVAALFKGILMARGQAHRHQREDRADEIAALQGVLDRLTADRDELKEEVRQNKEWSAKQLEKRDRIIGELRDEHTACLVSCERLTARVESLEAEVAQLRGA